MKRHLSLVQAVAAVLTAPRIPVTPVEPDGTEEFPPGVSAYCRQLLEHDAQRYRSMAAWYRATADRQCTPELVHRNLVLARQLEWLASDYDKLLTLSAGVPHATLSPPGANS